ncbi:hypothetical protein EVAR_41337_1 [Eumeta japonica]|uniref:Uncharacterized protein n=1 Tax=Eumeta variegata TaxID=151549 RepID=A0A4C1X2R1_EUMVA|nr:hypothetical protein EVAR_41337_1 [Eumeta japonica]
MKKKDKSSARTRKTHELVKEAVIDQFLGGPAAQQRPSRVNISGQGKQDYEIKETSCSVNLIWGRSARRAAARAAPPTVRRRCFTELHDTRRFDERSIK